MTQMQIYELNAAPDRVSLFEIASEQKGYFTAQQARTCAFSWSLLSHHVKAGLFKRVRRGLYRFRDYPSSLHEDLLVAWLAVGKEVAVISHESALDILSLSDVIPNAIHLTVPRSRRNRPSLLGVKIHTTARLLRTEDRLVRDGLAVTSAARSILDSAETGTAPEQIEMAIMQALSRSMVIADKLRIDSNERNRRVIRLIANALQREGS